MLCSSEASIRISVDGRQHRHRLVSVDRPKIRGILAEMMRPMATIGRRWVHRQAFWTLGMGKFIDVEVNEPWFGESTTIQYLYLCL